MRDANKDTMNCSSCASMSLQNLPTRAAGLRGIEKMYVSIQQIGTWSNRLRKMGGTKKWMGEPWEGGKKQQHVKHEGEKEHGQSGCWKIYGSTWNREPSESGVKEWKVKLKQVTVVLSYTTHSFIPNVSLLINCARRILKSFLALSHFHLVRFLAGLLGLLMFCSLFSSLKAKFELIMSEASYLRSLNVAVDHFQRSAELQAILSNQERQWLFSRLQDVRDVSARWDLPPLLPHLTPSMKSQYSLETLVSISNISHSCAVCSLYIHAHSALWLHINIALKRSITFSGDRTM